MNFLDNDFPEVTEAYRGSLEDWLELFERFAFPVGKETDTSKEMKRIFKRYPEATYEEWLDRVIKSVRDELWYEEKINLSIRELYLVVNKVARINEKLRATYNLLIKPNSSSIFENSINKLDETKLTDTSTAVQQIIYNINGKDIKLATDFMPAAQINYTTPGIYIWKRHLPGKPDAYYIGQAISLRERTLKHLRAPTKDSAALHAAIRKYSTKEYEGKLDEIFSVAILEFCPIADLSDREIYWIKTLKTFINKKDYNQTPGGEGGGYPKKVTIELFEAIINSLINDRRLTFSDISEQLKVSRDIISDINFGLVKYATVYATALDLDIQFPIRTTEEVEKTKLDKAKEAAESQTMDWALSITTSEVKNKKIISQKTEFIDDPTFHGKSEAWNYICNLEKDLGTKISEADLRKKYSTFRKGINSGGGIAIFKQLLQPNGKSYLKRKYEIKPI